MAASTPPKEKKRKRPTFAQIDQRNRAGLGWKSTDFGIPGPPLNLPDGVAARPSLVYSGLAGVSQPTQLPKPSMAGGVLPSDTKASSVLTPDQVAQARKLMNNPQEVGIAAGALDGAKTFLSNLFDVEDKSDFLSFDARIGNFDIPIGVEAAFDATLKGLNWGYDNLNHASTALLSAFPGGTQTLTWDQAQNVSVGQQFIANTGVSAGKMRRGEGNLGDLFATTFAAGPIASIGAAISPDSPIQQQGWDITNPNDMKAFESGPEKFFSGVTDLGFVFADPLIGAGKLAKLSRIKYVDRIVTTDAQRAQIKNELATLATTPDGGTLPPIADFVRWTQKIDPVTGQKIHDANTIANHPVLERATNREQLAKALHAARSFDVNDVLDPTRSVAVNGEELAALILRWAYNDKEAATQLAKLRPDIADGLSIATRNRIALMSAMNPGQTQRSIDTAEKVLTKAKREIKRIENAGLAQSPEWVTMNQVANNAQSTIDDLINGNFDFLRGSSNESRQAALDVYKSIVSSDTALAKAIGDDLAQTEGIRGALQGEMKSGAVRGFAVDTAAGRAIERRRQANAVAKTQSQNTRRQLRATGETYTRQVVVGEGADAKVVTQTVEKMARQGWRSDVYGNNGFTRGVRIWRRANQETPSGFIITKGIGAQESFRELRAQLNAIRTYSGKARIITLDDGTKISVGGVERKQKLMDMYMTALNDTTKGSDAAALALDRIETAIANDIAAWHGLSQKTAIDVMARANSERSRLMKDMTEDGRKFWVDEDGYFNTVKDPYLESQIANGRFLHNYERFEQLAAQFDMNPNMKRLAVARDFAGQNLSRVYNFFNDFWRPLVLMRLGYTVRNNIEGSFRAAAFTQSLNPIAAGISNGVISAGNLSSKYLRGKMVERAAVEARIKSARAGGRPLPKKFDGWLRTQINARDAEIFGNEALIADVAKSVASGSPSTKDWAVNFGKNWNFRAIFDLDNAIKAGASTDEIAGLQARVDDSAKFLNDVDSILFFRGLNQDVVTSWDNLKFMEKQLNDGYRRRDFLDDDVTALMLFYQQGRARARKYSGTIEAPDGTVLNAAFNPESGMSSVALSLLSADTTTRSMLSSRVEAAQKALMSYHTDTYQNVLPGQPLYWEGLSSAISQIRFSAVGSRIMMGESDEQIAKFLVEERDGREIMDFLRGNVPKASRRNTYKTKDALAIAAGVRSRYEQLVPTADLREFVEALPRGVEITPKGLENSFTGVTSQLSPVIGSVATEVGAASVMQAWRQFTGMMMRVLGTIPEDALTRSPFYGKRYEDTMRRFMTEAQQQSGTITPREIEFMQRQAHRRALKDTKDTLYTIDRPTVLGSMGEMTIPFISAAQNSITTVGRLIYNDPATAAILIDIWKAPAAANWEDSEGNIVIPIPHDWIPDGIEESLGLDVMRNWKLSKKQLNVIIPESGFGFVPRPGPIVAVPASEMMKKGLFGVTVESPPILRSILGGKENADTAWNIFKDYIFGEGQGLAPETLSYTMALPPVVQKAIQTWQGESSQQYTYWYNSIYRSEWLKWQAGMRDTIPQKDEVTKQTNGFQLMRMIANLTAVTPPQYETNIDALVDAYRQIDRDFPNDSARIANEKFGPMFQVLGDFSNSRNVAGMMPYADSVEAAKKYSGLIGEIAPGLEKIGDMSVISMLTMGNANQLYDDSAYGWQFANKIPGINRSYREMQTPDQSWVQSDVNAGWTTYLMNMDGLKARLRQSGATSFRANPALDQERRDMIAGLADNPFFSNWYRDYKDFGSSRTMSAVYAMQSALGNKEFMADNAESDIWQRASLYLYHRNIVLDAIKKSGKTIDNKSNVDIRNYWDQIRSDLESNTQWSAFAERFLNGDDNPEEPGVTFGYETTM